MLTKSQQVRQYQDTRIAHMGRGVPRFEKFNPTYPVVKTYTVTKPQEPDLDLFKYSPNQPRDARGRFASGGGISPRGGSSANPFFQPSNAPTWWPTMARDLTLVGLAAGAVGITPVIGLAGRGFSRAILRGLGPVAYRMAQRTGGNVVRTLHNLARQFGYKIPRSAMRGVPRGATAAAAAAAWRKMPPGAKKVVDDAVKTINRASRRRRST